MSDRENPPPLTLASEQSDETLAAARALQLIQWPMKELASNLLRVVRGAGRAWELPDQMVAVLEAVERYREVVGHYPSDHELSEFIRFDGQYGDKGDSVTDAYDKIAQGALQLVASTIVGQKTQQSAGESEMTTGVGWLGEAREENRLRHFGTAAQKAKIAEQDRISEEMARRGRELGSPKKAPPE